jgi:urea transport system substrate-binding protein
MSGADKKPPTGTSPAEAAPAPAERPVVQVGGTVSNPGSPISNPGEEDLSSTVSLPALGMVTMPTPEPSWVRRVDPRIGQMFGKYRVESVIGKGGMGMVYEGEDTALSRRVAIKFLPESLTQNPKAVDRFITEAQVAGRLNHPNIIAIYDIGQEADHYYIVMELLNPTSTATYVKDRGPLHWAEATKIIADCCAALHAAHQAGLIHRDIKPDNILCSPTGVTKLVDFGLVKDTLYDAAALTQTGVVAGTPLYMSPEQASDGALDHRTDVYSLGATYYTLLTGKPPYSGEAAPQIMFKHVTAPTPDPREIIPEIPEAVTQVVMKSMAKSPADRYQTADEMRQALEAALVDAPKRPYAFLVPHEPSLINMRRPRNSLYSTLPGGSVLSPKTSGSLAGLPSSRSLGMTTPGSAISAHSCGNQIISNPPSESQTRSGQQMQPTTQTSTPAFWVGALGLVAAMLALALLVWRNFRPDDLGGRPPLPVAVADMAVPPPRPPIKVGVLNSMSGTMAISTRPIVEATLLAIDEINAAGGLLGRRIEPIRIDGKSDNEVFARETERLITQEKVVTIFGGWTPSNRREMKVIVEKHDHLLVFPSRDEGMEDSPNIIYNGATPNQQVIPAVKWAAEKLGAKKIFVVGADGLLGHMCTELIKDTAKDLDVRVVGEKFVLLSETDFKPIAKKIVQARPDIIFNFVQGDSNQPFYRELREAGITPQKLPVISFSIGENEMSQLVGVDLAGDYLAWSYFESLQRPENERFVRAFKSKYGEHRGISDPMEAAYFGVHLWAQAVTAAGTGDDVRAIRRAMQGQSFQAPGARVHIDPSNNHTWKPFRVGKIVNKDRIEVIYSSEESIQPEPFPHTRTRAEWEALLIYLYNKWGGHWVNPERPNLLKLPRGKQN